LLAYICNTDLTSYTAKEFIAECNIANRFDHPNVLSLIGVSIVPDDDIPLMVMPYMLHGDVKSYLKSQRGNSIDADQLPKKVRTNSYFAGIYSYTYPINCVNLG